MVNTSTLPSYSPVNAMVLPSGEKAASVSMPVPPVSRVATPPCRGTLHRSPRVGEYDRGLVHRRFLQQVQGGAGPESGRNSGGQKRK